MTQVVEKSLKFSMLEVLGVENDVVTVLWWHVSWCCLYEHCMRERFYDTLLFRVMISIRPHDKGGGGLGVACDKRQDLNCSRDMSESCIGFDTCVAVLISRCSMSALTAREWWGVCWGCVNVST